MDKITVKTKLNSNTSFFNAVVSESTRAVMLKKPNLFSFDQTVDFLSQYNNEVLYRVDGATIYRLYDLNNQKFLISIKNDGKHLKINFLNKPVKKIERIIIIDHIWKWFDLSKNLSPFYKMARKNKILSDLVKKHSGLRLIRIPDLFEALSWAIIGQQINLSFAFSVKSQLIQKYGSSINYNGQVFYSFPKPEKIVSLSVSKLKKMKFSQRKAEYIKEAARQVISGNLNHLDQLNYEEIFEKLTAIRGIGPWTADYVLMKTFGYSQAFPVGDAGLQNAVKKIMNMKAKPTESQLRKIAQPWAGWEAYATFYLWRSLSVC